MGRRRERRSPELRRLDKLGPEGRRAEIQRILSEPPAPQSDVAELVAREVERQRRAEREAAEVAEVERHRHPDGGGCRQCGAAYSWTDDEPPWTSLDGGLVCVDCWNFHVTHYRLTDTPADRKVRVIADLLGLGSLPMRALGEPHAFTAIEVWFSEHDAEPVTEPEQRWAHVDLTELRRRWDRIAHGHDGLAPPEPEIVTLTGDSAPCESCGCVERFPAGHWIDPRTDEIRPLPGYCVDCTVAWLAQATGSVPEWWVERRGEHLPEWAKQLAQVPA